MTPQGLIVPLLPRSPAAPPPMPLLGGRAGPCACLQCGALANPFCTAYV